MRLVKTVFFVVGVLWPVAAQNNTLIDAFLEKEQADFRTAAYLVLVGTNLANESISLEQAQKFIQEKDWGFTESIVQEPIRAGTLSLLLMKSLDIQGGLFYSLLGGPWYAYKEAQYRGWFPATYSAFRVLKGWEVIQTLNTALEQRSPIREN